MITNLDLSSVKLADPSLGGPIHNLNIPKGLAISKEFPYKQGDVIVLCDRPVYQVDPITRKCKKKLQRFQVNYVEVV